MDLYAEMRSRIQSRATPEVLAKKDRWYEIKNAAGPVATLRIYSEIGFFGVTAEDFAADLDQITASDIEVQINSPGGEVFAGIAIYNALRSHPARVTTRVDGIAASIASVIAQAGDHRVMLESSQMMIHEAWGLAVGPAGDMREMADLLDRQSDVVAGIYAARAGGEVAKFRELMANQTWLTDAEAVASGLADEVVAPERQEPKNDLTVNVAAGLDIDDLVARLTAALKIPSTETSEETPPTGEPVVVAHEQAARLLSMLTLNKETSSE